MLNFIAASLAACLILTACGGGGDGPAASTPAAKTMKLSFYGNPLTSTSGAVVHADVSGVPASGAAAASVQSLQDALVAQGVPATVSVQVMDGSTLHALVMGTDNGLPPTPDQFKTDPSEWLIVNFQLDDMGTPASDPTQAAAIAQFQTDLTTFIQRGHVSGKQTFVVSAIPTCDAAALDNSSAADGLYNAESQASITGVAFMTGAIGGNGTTFDSTGKRILVNTVTAGHMGDDCRTPDASLQSLRTQAVATDIATRYKLIGNGI